jgi:Mg/Co/Ni transporter MgtE
LASDPSALLGQLFDKLQEEGFAMSYTMEDFQRQYAKEHFKNLTPEEQREALEQLSPADRRKVLQSLPVEELLTFLSAEQVQQLRDQLLAGRAPQPRKPRRKK